MTPIIPSAVCTFYYSASHCCIARSVRGDRMFLFTRIKNKGERYSLFVCLFFDRNQMEFLKLNNQNHPALFIFTFLKHATLVSAYTHTSQIPGFILSISNWDCHYLADDIVGISESTGYLSSLSRMDVLQAGMSDHKSATNLPYILSASLHCPLCHLGLRC